MKNQNKVLHVIATSNGRSLVNKKNSKNNAKKNFSYKTTLPFFKKIIGKLFLRIHTFCADFIKFLFCQSNEQQHNQMRVMHKENRLRVKSRNCCELFIEGNLRELINFLHAKVSVGELITRQSVYMTTTSPKTLFSILLNFL